MDKPDLRQLSTIMNLPIKRLRYVVNQDLLPNEICYIAEEDPGRARVFDITTATFIGCSALLIESGYKRDGVRNIMALVSRIPRPGRNPLSLGIFYDALLGDEKIILQIADGTIVRWKIGSNDTGWVDPSNLKVVSDYEPTIVTAIDLGSIRDRIRNS